MSSLAGIPFEKTAHVLFWPNNSTLAGLMPEFERNAYPTADEMVHSARHACTTAGQRRRPVIADSVL